MKNLMTRKTFAVVALWLTAMMMCAQQIALGDILRGSYSARSVRSVRPMADGESYSCVSDDMRKIERCSFKTGEVVETLFDAAEARGASVRRVEGYIMSPDEKNILIETNRERIYRRSATSIYYIYNVKNRTLTPLSEGGPQECPKFSPDGNQIAFVRDNNIFLVKLLFNNAESQITKDGERNRIINGKPDWVYEEEFSFNCAFDSRPQVYELVSGSVMSRKQDYPVGAMFSFPFAGLTEEGLPTFYINKEHTLIAGPQNYEELDFQAFWPADDQVAPGEVVPDYLKYEGSVEPSIQGSFNNRFSWRGISLEVFFTYSFGNVLRLDPLCYVYSSQYNDLTANMKEMKNRWVVPGDEQITTIPTIATKRQYREINNLYWAYSAYNYSTERVAKGDFIRLKSISLGYDLPNKYLEGQKAITKFGVKLTATNLWLAYADKKLNGRDPEYYNSGGVSSPVPRQFTMTFKLGF